MEAGSVCMFKHAIPNCAIRTSLECPLNSVIAVTRAWVASVLFCPAPASGALFSAALLLGTCVEDDQHVGTWFDHERDQLFSAALHMGFA